MPSSPQPLRAMLVVHRVGKGDQFVDFLCVHPNFRRCGYARQLLEHLDCPAELLVEERNRSAIRLYTKSGFEPTGRSFYDPAIGQISWRRERPGFVSAARRLEFKAWKDFDDASRMELREMARACGAPPELVMMEADDRVRVATL